MLFLKVVNKSLSLLKMRSEADSLKQMDQLHNAFLQLANIKTWDIAMQEYGQWLSEENLKPFKSLFQIKNSKISNTFAQFVQSIIQAKKNKIKNEEWKKFSYKQFEHSNQIIKCDVLNNLTSISDIASIFTLAIADIPYGIQQT